MKKEISKIKTEELLKTLLETRDAWVADCAAFDWILAASCLALIEHGGTIETAIQEIKAQINSERIHELRTFVDTRQPTDETITQEANWYLTDFLDLNSKS